jgi:alkyldihydroxyacetonephosphate synthase
MQSSKHPNPRWVAPPPEKGSYRSILKWGAPEGYKHPNLRLLALLKDRLNLPETHFETPQKIGAEPVGVQRPRLLSDDIVQSFREMVGGENVAEDDFARVKYASGKTMEEIWQLRQQQVVALPDLVIHPRNKEDVAAVVQFSHKRRIPIYVYGGGSSVNFGFRPVKGGIILAMGTHMNRILDFNETNQSVTVEPGIMGPAYEKALNRAAQRFQASRAYTGGHFPQSFEFSTVGGWIAALGSGQQSSYYGDMADLVLSQEVVTPAGSVQTLPFPGTATGPKVNHMLMGSEGAFGILVSATLKIFRHMPLNSRPFAFIFPRWRACVRAAREISQAEFGMPSILRISDPEETEVVMRLYGIEGTVLDRFISLRGHVPGERCLLIGQADGQRGFAANLKRVAKRICRRQGGLYITGLPVKRWARGRFKDPYLRDDLNDHGILIDTLEAGVTWDRLHHLYTGVRRFIKARPHTICMIHASHFYPQGTNLYFIFLTPMDDITAHRRFQAGIIDNILAHGGSLSHHHGVGKLMAPWMETHLGTEQMAVLKALKKHFDPHNIMNPGGTLGLDP